MPTSLRNRLNELAAAYAASVLDAIRGASLEELLSESSGNGAGRQATRAAARAAAAPAEGRRRSGRLPRRSAGDIEEVVGKIVALLKDQPEGLRAEQIREALGIQAKELPRPLKEAIDRGQLSKSGQKRATTYFLKGSGRSSGGGGRRGGRGASRKAAGRRPRASKRNKAEEASAAAEAS